MVGTVEMKRTGAYLGVGGWGVFLFLALTGERRIVKCWFYVNYATVIDTRKDKKGPLPGKTCKPLE